MPYVTQTWEDAPSTATPISAARLAHIEEGVDDAHTAIDALTAAAIPASPGGGLAGTTVAAQLAELDTEKVTADLLVVTIVANAVLKGAATQLAASSPGVDLRGYGTTNLLELNRANGNTAAPTAITNNTQIGAVSFGGYDGSSWQKRRAAVRAQAAENWDADSGGTNLIFETTPVGLVGADETMRLTHHGHLILAAGPTPGNNYWFGGGGGTGSSTDNPGSIAGAVVAPMFARVSFDTVSGANPQDLWHSNLNVVAGTDEGAFRNMVLRNDINDVTDLSAADDEDKAAGVLMCASHVHTASDRNAFALNTYVHLFDTATGFGGAAVGAEVGVRNDVAGLVTGTGLQVVSHGTQDIRLGARIGGRMKTYLMLSPSTEVGDVPPDDYWMWVGDHVDGTPDGTPVMALDSLGTLQVNKSLFLSGTDGSSFVWMLRQASDPAADAVFLGPTLYAKDIGSSKGAIQTRFATGPPAVIAREGGIVDTRDIVAQADQVKTNNTLASDDELVLAVGANEVWEGDLVVRYVGMAADDIQVQLTFPTSPTKYHWDALGPQGSATGSPATAVWVSRTDATGAITLGAFDSPLVMTARMSFVVFNGANAGSVTFRFANNGAGGSTLTRLKGSRMLARRTA